VQARAVRLRLKEGGVMKKINLLIAFILFLALGFYVVKHGNRTTAIQAVPAALNADAKSAEKAEEIFAFQDAFTKVVEKSLPAACNISASYIVEMKQPLLFDDFFSFPFEDFFEMPRKKYKKRKYKSEATGSGVIIDADGYVLTNEHVIKNADEIKVTVYTGGKGKIYPAEVIGHDSQTDIAVIKIKGKRKFPYLPMGDSSSVKIGSLVLAIGSPFGLAQTVTSGIISAERQSIQVQNKIYDDMIQTDAAINRGNSGGPLINMKGEVIGINTAIVAPAGGFIGVGFAIPINKAKDILGTLIEKGEVLRGWLGIEMRAVDEVVKKQFGLSREEGVLVNRVVPGSPAGSAGFKRGDIIVRFNGRKIKGPLSLRKNVQGLPPGKKVKAEIIREGKNVVINVKLGKYGEASVSAGEFEWKGLKVKNVSNAHGYRIPEGQKGVVVVEIDYSSMLADSGLIVGDVICGINRRSVSNVSEFKQAVKSVKIKEGVIFDVSRNGAPLYITFIP